MRNRYNALLLSVLEYGSPQTGVEKKNPSSATPTPPEPVKALAKTATSTSQQAVNVKPEKFLGNDNSPGDASSWLHFMEMNEDHIPAVDMQATMQTLSPQAFEAMSFLQQPVDTAPLPQPTSQGSNFADDYVQMFFNET